MTLPIEPTQEDREAAAEFFRSADCPLSVKMVLGSRSAPLIAALACHRLSAAATARRTALEEAAKVAEAERTVPWEGGETTKRNIATAIRVLGQKQEEVGIS